MSLYVHRGDLEFLQRGADWKVEHPNGYYQPGVLVLSNDGRVLYRWRSNPGRSNLFGTVSRPTPEHVLGRVSDALAASAEAGNTSRDVVPDAPHDDSPEIDSTPPPLPVFLAMILANGWFLRIKSCAYSPGAPPIQRRFATAGARWLLFIGFWILAAVYLPWALTAVALAGWLAWVRRDMRTNFSLDGESAQIRPRT